MRIPQLLNVIKSTKIYQQRNAAADTSSFTLDEFANEDLSLANLINTTLRSQFIKGVQRILLPRVQSHEGDIDSQEAFDILKESIDSTKSFLLNSLPNLSGKNYQPELQKNNFAKDLILMGALGLSELEGLISSCQINNILVIDDGYESLAKLIQFKSFQDIIVKCKQNKISLHFIIEKDLDSLNLLKQLACEMFSACFGFYLVISPPPSALLESVTQWLKSQEGFAEYLMGLLGQETDEVNQSIHSIYNYRFYPNRSP